MDYGQGSTLRENMNSIGKENIIKKINEYLNVKQAAEFLGVASLTLRRWEKQGKIKVTRNPMNNYRVYTKEGLEELLEILSRKREEAYEKVQVLVDAGIIPPRKDEAKQG